ncbi:ATP-binding protein [Candidatus Enterococcus mansonii]|uniref:histidine kinase n=1 Tax=Candidatus Enterococcus mansonii TaxID=1834181 RepID=A0A242CDP5_9ENTE|nr:ATP-binding protein [Enterococcus sp. 4G2_DIV0659]OTO08384.1 hypothetical protein A5880_001384 [Enterococcus sp. 4G2_DIV0659]
MNKSRRKSWIQLSALLLIIFIGVSACFFELVLYQSNYIGVEGRKEGSTWVVTKLQADGAANASGVKINDEIKMIDGNPVNENKLLNNWLIVEQATSVVISRDGIQQTLLFSKNNRNLKVFGIFFAISLIYLIFLIELSKKQIANNSSKRFYQFSVLVIFTLLSVVPSSIGDYFGRTVIILFISVFPFYIYTFLSKAIPVTEVNTKVMRFIGLVALVNGFLMVTVSFVQLPVFLIEYLSVGVFYMLGFNLLILSISDLQKRFSNRKGKEVTQVNISLISLLSFVPLFLFYILPTGWVAPFYLVVIFTIFPIFGVIHLLILSRFLRYRYRMNQSMLYFILAFILSATIVLVSLLSRYVPLAILLCYVFLLIYSFFPLIGELILTVKRKKEYSDPVSLFVAVEDERESISTYIHDTVIQDIIYLMKIAEEKESNVEKELIIQELDEVIFNLRELCSDIYPLMIQEMGLTNTIVSMIEQVMKKYSVAITHTIDTKIEHYPKKVNNFILRSLKECINNSILHGKADEIEIMIACKKEACEFQVLDNGKYVQKKADDQSHFGLEVIKEKLILLGGELSIETNDQTIITMTLPYNHLKGEVI